MFGYRLGTLTTSGRRAALAIAVSLALAAGAGGCGSTPTEQAPPPPSVTVAHPIERNVADYLDFTGNTAAVDSVTLVARVEGYLEKIHFADGALVRKGQLLFTIQQDQYKAQLQQAEANVAAQKAALWHAKVEFARYSHLLTEDAATQTEVDQWHYKRDASAADLLAAEAQVVLAKLNLSYTTVTSPFDGRIGRHLVNPGNLVGTMGQQTPLAEVNQINPLYVYFTINERDLLRIIKRAKASPGQIEAHTRVIPVYLGLSNEEGFPHVGRLDFASISVAPTTGTLQLRGIFPNPELTILPGLFVRVRLKALQMREALLVPGDAINFDQQGEYVLVVNDKNMVVRNSIKTTFQVGDMMVIESGLKADDWVITEGLLQAIPGREVNPQRSKLSAPVESDSTGG
ncbi:MAG TPA: efflux RND transporter periplasmic adaptor subunit [Candidatus Binataceae bacterium]|nr:efflux RND transporter periplasmic adaptor subunit [Candidatus Binataceae bacterium]